MHLTQFGTQTDIIVQLKRVNAHLMAEKTRQPADHPPLFESWWTVETLLHPLPRLRPILLRTGFRRWRRTRASRVVPSRPVLCNAVPPVEHTQLIGNFTAVQTWYIHTFASDPAAATTSKIAQGLRKACRASSP